MIFVLDANIVIKYLKNNEPIAMGIEQALFNGDSVIIPKIVDYEVRRGFAIYPAPKQESIYQILIENCPVRALGGAVWDRSIHIYQELYKKGYTVGEMDILIAGFCLTHGYTLVTNNRKDFGHIKGLQLVDWSK